MLFRVNKTKNYTIMANYHFKEKEMSLKAKGLLSLMLSLPDDWDYTEKGIVLLSKDSIDSVRTAIKELEKFGYLKRQRKRDSKGMLRENTYDVYECPMSEYPTLEKPILEKPTQLNTIYINNLNNKKEEIYKEEASQAKPSLESVDVIENDSTTDLEISEYNFNVIWDEYPDKKGKAEAFKLYCSYIKGRKVRYGNGYKTYKLTDEQMYYAVVKYAEENKYTDKQYIQNGGRFFNKTILDYIEEE